MLSDKLLDLQVSIIVSLFINSSDGSMCRNDIGGQGDAKSKFCAPALAYFRLDRSHPDYPCIHCVDAYPFSGWIEPSDHDHKLYLSVCLLHRGTYCQHQ